LVVQQPIRQRIGSGYADTTGIHRAPARSVDPLRYPLADLRLPTA